MSLTAVVDAYLRARALTRAIAVIARYPPRPGGGEESGLRITEADSGGLRPVTQVASVHRTTIVRVVGFLKQHGFIS